MTDEPTVDRRDGPEADGSPVPTVVSLGSVNVDRIRHVSDAEVDRLGRRHDWFPDRGETVKRQSLPDDVLADPDRIRHGGKGANQAVAAAAAGASTAMLGAVGEDHDEFGSLSALCEAGVDTARVAVVPDPTGTAVVFVEPDGENRIIVRPGANDAVDGDYVRTHRDVIRGADCLLLQNEIPVGPVAALLDSLAGDPERPTVVLDPAPTAGVDRLVAHDAVDYLTPNETEYAALGDPIDAFDGTLVRKHGPDEVVVENDERFVVTPPTVEAVDATGAGDVLNGVLAARLAAGDTPREAVELGVIAASLSTREAGARGGVPRLETVRSVRASRRGSD